MCQEHGPGNRAVKMTNKLKSIVKNEDMVAKCYCIVLLRSWDSRTVGGASLLCNCIVIEFLLNIVY
jgi:hypothetical protein